MYERRGSFTEKFLFDHRYCEREVRMFEKGVIL